MSHGTKPAPSFPAHQQHGPLIASARVAQESEGEGSIASLAADRLYQLAAVTTGIFLLVSLL